MFTNTCLLLLAISSVVAIDLIVEHPPPEQMMSDPEWTIILDDEGNSHIVNTWSAMNEPIPYFNPDIGVMFELYTLQNPKEMQLIHTGNVGELANSYFNPNRPTRIVIHGWNSRGSVTETFQKAYFEDGKNDVNFFAVNWQAGSNTFNYISARRNVNVVGPAVSRFVDFLVKYGGMNPNNLIIIGHSLGGHVAGLSGKYVTCGRLPKIVALDPAKPLFSMDKPNERVAVGDARVVEIIHTAAGFLGFSAPLGDASFYPNGGRSQPGCGIDMLGSCAHSRSIEYYAEAINSAIGFYSFNCSSYEEFRKGRCNTDGKPIRFHEYINVTGVYYLETNSQSPFALGNPQNNENRQNY